MHQYDVKQSVGYAGLRGNIGIVAPLRGIAYRHKEGLFSENLAVGTEGIGLRTELKILTHCAPNIAQQSAPALSGKTVADSCIEAHAECAEKRMVVHRAVIAGNYVVGGHNSDGGLHIYRDAEMPGQTIAGTCRENAQRRRRTTKGSCRLVHRSVAATRKHAFIAFVHSLARQAGGISTSAGDAHIHLKAES